MLKLLPHTAANFIVYWYMLSRILKIFIASNLFIASAAVAMMWVSCVWLHVPLFHSKWLIIEVFFSTWFIYQFSRYIYYKKGIFTDESELVLQSFKQYPLLNLWSIIISALLSVIAFFFLHTTTKAGLICTGLISILYPAPIGKLWSSNMRLRDIPIAKIFLIMLVWSVSCVLLPVWENGISIQERKDVYVLFLIQCVFLLFITLPFDIHDYASDKQAGLKTIPVLVGTRTAKWVCFFLGLLYVIGLLYLFMLENWRSITSIYLSETGILLIILLVILLQVFTFYRSDKTEKWIIKLVYDGSMLLYFFIMILTCKTA